MAWETFTREHARTTGPRITLTSMGRISLNNGATDQLVAQHERLTNGENLEIAVLLLWDRDFHKIALQRVELSDPRSYPFKVYTGRGKNAGNGFSAVTFLNHIKYDWSMTRSFPAECIDGMLVVNIDAKLLNGKQEDATAPKRDRKAK